MSSKKNASNSAGPQPVDNVKLPEYKRGSGNAKAAPAASAAPSKPAPAAAAASAGAAPAAAAAAPKPKAQQDVSHLLKESKKADSGVGVVRAVLSGDSILILDRASGSERTLTLSGIQAPRFARSKNANDEAWAWHAREFLRKKLIGTVVSYAINFSQPPSGSLPGREYATVTAERDENVAASVVRAGWATVKSGGVGKDGKMHADREALQKLEAEAAKAELGVHNKAVSAEDVQRLMDYTPDARALMQKYKGVAIPAVVDQVKDGSTLRVELVPDVNRLSHIVITVFLAGVQCPRIPLPPRAGESKKAEQPEYMAVEAHRCTEDKLLHRDVNVLLQGTDKFGNFFGTIQFPMGNISRYLLENGFGKLVDWSAKLTPDYDAYVACQAAAQKAKARLWKDFKGTAAVAKPEEKGAEFRVAQIVSGDTLFLADAKGVETKVSLASVRAPRVGNAKRGDVDEPHAFEAREFLRKKLIGKNVKRIVDYSRTPGPAIKDGEKSKEEKRPFVTITFEGQNVAEMLVAAGLATVIKHRADEARASAYEALCVAEQQALEGKRGVHDVLKSPPVHHITDLSERFGKDDKSESTDVAKRSLASKARGHLSSLIRVPHGGVVEYVFTGSRLKILVPKEKIIISLALAGVRAPGPKTKEGKADPMGELSLLYTRRNVLQQNVMVEVETIDKGDNFIGSVFLNEANLSVHLLEEGLAEVFKESAERSKYKAQLFAAEEAAKKAKKGIWKNWVPTVAAPAASADAKTGAVPTGFQPIKVTEILTGSHFYVQFASEQKNIDKVESEMNKFDEDANKDVDEKSMKVNAVFAGHWDGAWYRVRVTSKPVDDFVDVLFIDYGNSDRLSTASIKELPASVKQIKPVAHECYLAAVKAPGLASEYYDDSANAFNELVFEKPELVAKVEFVDVHTGCHHLSVHTSLNEPTSVNVQLLDGGHVRLASGKLAELYQEHEENAKKKRVGIWAYGNVSDEEESAAANEKSDSGYGKKGNRK